MPKARMVRVTYPKVSETFVLTGDEKDNFKNAKKDPDELGMFMDMYVSDMDRGTPRIEVVDDKGKVIETLKVRY